jgi:hypothetical protein
MNSVYQARVLQLAAEIIAKLAPVHGCGTSGMLIDVSELGDLLRRVRSMADLPGIEVPSCFSGAPLLRRNEAGSRGMVL